MKHNPMIFSALLLSFPVFAQSSYTIGAIGSSPNPSGRTADAQAQSAATNAFLTTNPSSGMNRPRNSRHPEALNLRSQRGCYEREAIHR